MTADEDVADSATWAGSVPQVHGVAPRVRVGRERWFNLLWLLPIGLVLLMVAVHQFIACNPGTVVSAAAAHNPGFPIWVGVQHFFNLFLLIFIIRSGIQILSDHPRLYWTRNSAGRDWFRIQKPVPADRLWTAKKDRQSI